jgi:hypothetical protein
MNVRPAIVIALSVLWMASCADDGGPEGDTPGPPTLREVLANRRAFDDRTLRVRAAYFSSFEVSVLTTGFAESHPPQPVEPVVWVDAAPPDRCMERVRDAAWAESVVASGLFRFAPDSGFGHLGAYDMALEDATLSCD